MTVTDVELAVGASGLLQTFNEAGVLDVSDVRVAERICALGKEPDERVALAVALLVRGAARRIGVRRAGDHRLGGRCRRACRGPSPTEWLAAVRASTLLGEPPVLHLYDDRLLYLDRYWREEKQVCDDLLALRVSKATVDMPASERLFPAGFEEQREAAEIALAQAVTVLTGGPGTGKTTTVARLLALLAEQAELAGASRPRIALAAPTGKAAARLQEAVQHEVAKLDAADRARLGELQAMTLHRLLGSRPDSSSRFRHDRGNRLPHDVIVVDETSMVSLTMMARLLEAVRPDARLVLGRRRRSAGVGGSRCGAGRFGRRPFGREPTYGWRRCGRRTGSARRSVFWPTRSGSATRIGRWSYCGPATSTSSSSRTTTRPMRCARFCCRMRCGCAKRRCSGPMTWRWRRWMSIGCSARTGKARTVCGTGTGRSRMALRRDGPAAVVGVVSGAAAAGDGQRLRAARLQRRHRCGRRAVPTALRAVIAGAGGPLDFATSRLSDVETMHAMTIHKSQGSQADEVTVLMPPEDSRLLTRELFYTAVTRAKEKVRVVGSEAVASSCDRTQSNSRDRAAKAAAFICGTSGPARGKSMKTPELPAPIIRWSRVRGPSAPLQGLSIAT